MKEMKGRIQGMPAYNFSLQDTSGKIVRLSDFKGKVIFMDFWGTGCYSCVVLYKNAYSIAKEYFKKDTNFVFIAVNLDTWKDGWLKGIKRGLQTSHDAINVYTNGLGWQSPIIKHYNIYAISTALIVDKKGNIYRFHSPELYESASLIKTIKEALNQN